MKGILDSFYKIENVIKMNMIYSPDE